MVIEIESYKKEEDGIFLTGKKYSIYELRKMVKTIIEISDNNFIPLFCRYYMFDTIENYKGYPDVINDLDIHYVYCPYV